VAYLQAFEKRLTLKPFEKRFDQKPLIIFKFEILSPNPIGVINRRNGWEKGQYIGQY